ncbi:MAG: hypothetical protein WDO15_04320 [Bacteroidota bacterium]
MYFEENYVRGRLVNGRSRSKNGRTAVYDQTIFFALPEGGYQKLNEYIRSQLKEPQGKGTVKLSFRVTVSGQLTDFKVEHSVFEGVGSSREANNTFGTTLAARKVAWVGANGWVCACEYRVLIICASLKKTTPP